MRAMTNQPFLSILFGLVFITAMWNSTQASGHLADQLIESMINVLQQTSDTAIDPLEFKECLTPE